MKVLHFYRTYYPDTFGGVEQVIRQMVAGSTRLGIEAEVLTLTRDVTQLEIEYEGRPVHRAPLDFEIASTGFSRAALTRFKQLAGQADIIHYHFPWPFMDMAHFLCGIKKPSVVTYHSDIVRQKYLLKLYQPLQNAFLRKVDRIVATSPNYLETSPTLNQFREKTDIITYGLDRSIYPQAAAQDIEKWRARFPMPFFLFVGMLRYYKGLHVLLDAVAGIDIPIVILGNGPVEQELLAQAQRLKLNNVHFLGALPEADKVALMSLCYGLAFPSHLRSEAFGITLLEAAMFGKPMVSCEIGTGTSYVNQDQHTGIVVPPNDPLSFRTAMQRLLQNPELASTMGKNAALRYENLFTAERMAQGYQSLYQSLLK